jgi:hypothetical protein
VIAIVAITEMANHAGNEPWPSLDDASKWFDRASIALAISLAFGCAATVIIVWLGIVKEHHWDLLRERSAKQIASIELETAKVNEQAKLAEERAAEAKLELEKLKTPRSLSAAHQAEIAAKIKQFSGQTFDVALNASDPEAGYFWNGLEDAILAAGWTQLDWKGGMIVFDRTPRKTAGVISVIGVIVQMHPDKAMAFSGAALALVAALKAVGIDARAEPGSGTQAENNEAMHILVGRKP